MDFIKEKLEVWSVGIRLKIFFADILFSVFDYISDIFFLQYMKQSTDLWYLLAVIFLLLPSITYFIDSIVKKTFQLEKTLPTAIFLPILCVYRAMIWFLDPTNIKKRNQFWELKIHEVAYESLMQLLLQIHVFLHYGFKDGGIPLSSAKKAMLIASLLSSFLNAWYGMNNYWLLNQFPTTHPRGIEKLKLMFTTLCDLLARLLFMVTIFASIHGLGFLVIFYLYICQPILMFQRHPQIEATFDITRLFNPIFYQNNTREIQVENAVLKHHRISYKRTCNLTMSLTLSLMAVLQYTNHVEDPCVEERVFNFTLDKKCENEFWDALILSKEGTFYVLFPTIFGLIFISSLEIIYYHVSGKTWLDWILKRTKEAALGQENYISMDELNARDGKPNDVSEES